MQHEIGHLLGLALWGPESELVMEAEDHLYFVGRRAVAAFQASGGDPGLPGVPFDGVHFSFIDPLTEADYHTIHVAALADAGYTVDMTKAKDPP